MAIFIDMARVAMGKKYPTSKKSQYFSYFRHWNWDNDNHNWSQYWKWPTTRNRKKNRKVSWNLPDSALSDST
ncbi:MAG: hypothetical protein CBB74_01880 [Owenweeksia sp. TMED14]|nr:MAG: hypothetical protein CBB74_01880 [Owenweeksia sp. TMED14]